jgi:molybdopterin-biosynthesis enzyme MoeA-like protein
MQAVAHHLGVGLTVEPTIDARISAALERNAASGTTASAEHDRSVRRMALVPQGAYLLGDRGFAPGVAVDVDGGSRAGGATIVILPGIPDEFRRITRDCVEPELLVGRGRPQHVVEIDHPYPESALNPVLEQLEADYPDVHVGSYPGRRCTVRLKGPREQVEGAATQVREALAAVEAAPGSDRLRATWQAHWPADEPA